MLKPRKIVMVEDNPDDADLTILSLKEAGILNEVVLLENGAQALDYLFCTGQYATRKMADAPTLILLDIKLPLMDGLAVLSRLRANEQTKTLPVVMLTSSREDVDLVRAYESGANAYVCKPVNLSDFSEAVRKLGMFWLLLNAPPSLHDTAN